MAARSTQLAADDIQAIILSPGAAAGSTIGSVVLAASVSTVRHNPSASCLHNA